MANFFERWKIISTTHKSEGLQLNTVDCCFSHALHCELSAIKQTGHSASQPRHAKMLQVRDCL